VGNQNNMGNVPCQRRWHSYHHPHNILPIITKYYNFLEVQRFLKEDNFTNKCAKKNFKIVQQFQKEMQILKFSIKVKRCLVFT
jgi:hypothetical protein